MQLYSPHIYKSCVFAGGALLPHPGRHVALGKRGLLPHGLRSVPRHERLGSLPDRLHHREVHRHLSPHEGPGKLIVALKETGISIGILNDTKCSPVAGE